jgi:hypothetical protein
MNAARAAAGHITAGPPPAEPTTTGTTTAEGTTAGPGITGAPWPATLLTRPAAGLRPWREVVQPHDEVASGRLALADFAADLYQVAAGDGAPEYADPAAFFRRTFLTAGLRQLLGDAVMRLTAGGGPPVAVLRTGFGGGKTHAMIALHHLFSGHPIAQFPREVSDLIVESGVPALPAVRQAVLVGTRIAPGQEDVKPDGTRVGTLWGELAWQLGGPAGFAALAGSDQTRTSPGPALHRLLAAAAPCLVLLDEWVAYARQLYTDDSLRAGTFDTQLSFAQGLTEAARATSGVLLVVSVPAGDAPGEADAAQAEAAQAGGAGGRAALRRLGAVLGRTESAWQPATAAEGLEIVARRLFRPLVPGSRLARDAIVGAFSDFYRARAPQFPPECREAAYTERLRQAYPLHPELADLLRGGWAPAGPSPSARQVLRLMAAAVHALWTAGDQCPLILPATMPLGDPAVAAEVTRSLGDAWRPVLDADVDGPAALPGRLDRELASLGRYQAARRAARTVFLGSAPSLRSPEPGLDAARIRLGCALPGETVASFDDALARMAERATYLYAAGGRFWYATQPGVARVASDRAQRLLSGDRAEIHDQLAARLPATAGGTLRPAAGRPGPIGGPAAGSASTAAATTAAGAPASTARNQAADFTSVHVAPGRPADVPDIAAARLVIMDPGRPHRPRSAGSLALSQARALLDSRGRAPREYRNMLVFLAADQRRIRDLEQAAAYYLAWASVAADRDTLGLDPSQAAQAARRRDDADQAASSRLADAYRWLLVPRQPEPAGPIEWDEVPASGPGSLAERAGRALRHGGGLYLSYPPVLLRLQLDGPLAPLWQDGHTTVRAVWEACARYPYLHRLRDIGTLCATAAAAAAAPEWAAGGLAVADGHDPGTGAYTGLAAGAPPAAVTAATLLVHPAAARADPGRPPAVPPLASPPAGRSSRGPDGTPPRPRRFRGSAAIRPGLLGPDASRIAEEIVAHLTALPGTTTEITVEIRSASADGFPEDVMRTVTENAAALKFAEHHFEPDPADPDAPEPAAGEPVAGQDGG